MPFPRIAVILINYRTPQMTLDCLASLAAEMRDCPGSRSIVLDSASGDRSADVLEERIKAEGWESWAKVVRLETNRGFSAGNNAGLSAAQPGGSFDAFLLLNSDTIVRSGALRVLGTVLERDPWVGMVGPRLEWPCGQAQVSCFQEFTPLTELVTAAKTGPVSRLFSRGQVAILDPAIDRKIEWISFACVLIRREVIEAIGRMDEAFFMYFEDVDYCRRARAIGWRIAYAPEARVVHLRGGRTPEEFESEERKRRPSYYYQSRARYFAKYFGPSGPWQANLCWLLGRGVSLAREITGTKRPHTASHEAADIWKGSFCGFAKTDSPGTH